MHIVTNICFNTFAEWSFHPLQECKKQAQQIMKKRGFDDVEQTRMYVTIEQDIELIPVSKGTGWKIDAKVSPTVVRL